MENFFEPTAEFKGEIAVINIPDEVIPVHKTIWVLSIVQKIVKR